MNRSARPSRRAIAITTATATALALAVLPTSAALAASPAVKCDNRNNNTISKLTECVTADGVKEHLAAFQAIADANGGNRAANTAGYDASVDYVADTLTAAGWQVHTETSTTSLTGPPTSSSSRRRPPSWENEAPQPARAPER